MKRQEFIDLFDQQDDISAKKVSNILMQYCQTTQNEEVKNALAVLDTLGDVIQFMEKMEKVQMCEKPYTIQDAIKCLQSRILRVFIDSLEE